MGPRRGGLPSIPGRALRVCDNGEVRFNFMLLLGLFVGRPGERPIDEVGVVTLCAIFCDASTTRLTSVGCVSSVALFTEEGLGSVVI